MCGKKVYPLAQNEEVCEHLFAVCKEDAILYASEAFLEIIAHVYDLPRAVLLDCISQGVSRTPLRNFDSQIQSTVRGSNETKA